MEVGESRAGSRVANGTAVPSADSNTGNLLQIQDQAAGNLWPHLNRHNNGRKDRRGGLPRNLYILQAPIALCPDQGGGGAR